MRAAKQLPRESLLPYRIILRPKPAHRDRMHRYLRGWAWLFVFGIIAVSRWAAVAQAGYQVDHLQRELVRLQTSHQELVVKVSALSAPGRISGMAQGMGLRQPSRVVLVQVPGGQKRSPAGSALQRANPWQGILRQVGRMVSGTTGPF